MPDAPNVGASANAPDARTSTGTGKRTKKVPAKFRDGAVTPAKPPAKRARGRPPSAYLGPVRAEISFTNKDLDHQDFSITVSLQNRDLDVLFYGARIERFLQKMCVSGLFAVERGGTCKYLHFQGIIRIHVSGTLEVRNLFLKAMGWTGKAHTPPGAHLCVKSLAGAKLHTYHGMIGYCLKDEREEHFKLWEKNISDEEKDLGRGDYMLFGKTEDKNRIELNQKNILPKMRAFVMFPVTRAEQPNISKTFKPFDVLHKMVREYPPVQ